MIILIWVVGIVGVIILGGELRFRHLKTNNKISNKHLLSKEWIDSIDRNIGTLDIETSVSNIVPVTSLAMRGSWRLAQELVMDTKDFTELLDSEFSKNL